ncbi:unnamed protein product [Blumeria hordei]|uniref:polynucleotide adenylyltransferase n=1 Tax=Blumeria hordei TaxID=2867405 RepID=A0A383UXY7_BLUHO|nr:unnamed protein product [Blumeria hordei]
MEGLPLTYDSQYRYKSSHLWNRHSQCKSRLEAVPTHSPNTLLLLQPLSRSKILPILHLDSPGPYHRIRLLHYRQPIAPYQSIDIHSPYLDPTSAAQQAHDTPGTKNCSIAITAGKTIESSGPEGNGNKDPRIFSKGERVLVAEVDNSAKMPAQKECATNQHQQRPLRSQPYNYSSIVNQQSNSVPSTPHQHPRTFSFESQEPSPNATNNHSPRSAYSESNLILPSSRSAPQRGGCRYETALANIKRRMPYSLGGEKLERLDPSSIKTRLSPVEEELLSKDINELYQQLLPSPECKLRREKLVCKLEKLFNEKWPGHNTLVHVFGSSGNSLCTDQSDVDICITTDMKEMEGVCVIADLLAKNGMQKVICVSTAKVPIVKIWDPELRLACDMNVNNTLALENTRMIKTYVQIDERVRPLAMIIKHWTKRRIVNDAAFGGTLSSYTWICMIINFLQSRNPPILPALHQRPHSKLPTQNGVESAFADDVETLRNFGEQNKESLGELLFAFFRFYAHEFDYDSSVISVRSGKQILKIEKGWNITNNNRLCVEEPFNTSRNLGNTADDTSFRGLHLEIRRAFDLISHAKLSECCEEWVFPKEEERKIWEPATKTKVVLRSASASRGGRGNAPRMSRYVGQQGRSSSNSRRASSAAHDPNNFPQGTNQPGVAPQEAWMQRQAQTQLHNDLLTTYSALQAHENNLRLQLYSQGMQTHAYIQPQPSGTTKHKTLDRNRTSSFDQIPHPVSVHPDVYYYPMPYQGAPLYKYQNCAKSPSLTSTGPAMPEMRKGVHRSMMTNGLGQATSAMQSPLRAYSQVLSPSAQPEISLGAGAMAPKLDIYHGQGRQDSSTTSPKFIADENIGSLSLNPLSEEVKTMEYVGYYMQENVSIPTHRNSMTPMRIPFFDNVNQPKRRHSTDQLLQLTIKPNSQPSRSPSPLLHDTPLSGTLSTPNRFSSCQCMKGSGIELKHSHKPVDSSVTLVTSPVPTRQNNASCLSVQSGSNLDSKKIGLESSHQLTHEEIDTTLEQDRSPQVISRELRAKTTTEHQTVAKFPIVADLDTIDPKPSKSLKNDKLTGLNFPNFSSSEKTCASPYHSMTKSQSRQIRQGQGGTISPLDIECDTSKVDSSNLSPERVTSNHLPSSHQKPDVRSSRNINGSVSNSSKTGSVAMNQTTKPIPPKTLPAPQHYPSTSSRHIKGIKSEGGGPGSWQQVSKNKKKSLAILSKSNADGYGQSEKMPINISERKGG